MSRRCTRCCRGCAAGAGTRAPTWPSNRAIRVGGARASSSSTWDGDDEFPTHCGTGTEDYFGGAWNFDVGGRYVPYSTAYLGLPQVLPPTSIYQPGQRFGLSRWHDRDPICFDRETRVTAQVLGWQSGRRYLPLTRADVATTAFWYLDRPTPVSAPEAGDLAVLPLDEGGSRWTELRSRLRPRLRRLPG